MKAWRAWLLVAALLAGCDLRPEIPGVERIRERGELVVLTRNAPTTYYLGRNQDPEGFEHDLALAFGNHLGVPVRFRLYHTRSDILEAMQRNEG
ncbi:MAG: membrane-bound lytic murein transglycosylase MltF, partial [Magnetococcales bacterium]|nr:membrane-bound lytic murein transglycosylase MltF [Magnetococcales bacterium]